MGLHRASGYALRRIVLGEADYIVEFFTHESGRVRLVARGARKLRSRFGSALEPLTRSRIIYFQRDGDDLGRLSSCELERSYYDDLGTPLAAATAAYIAELLMGFTPERDPAPDVFRLVGAVMEALAAGLPVELAARYFEVWILRLSGLLPQLDRCGSCGKRLGEGRWVATAPLEFICRRSCQGTRGRRWLSPRAVALLRTIVRERPEALPDAPDQRAVARLAAANRLLIAGHLERELRSWRYLKRVRSAG